MWGGDYYALDIYNGEFREYLKDVFGTICNKWNFDLIKVDFIFAVASVVRKDKTRGEIINDALEFLNEVTEGKMILGCGVPLGSAFGKVPYCRIGPDVSLQWEDERLKKINYRERISTVSSLTNTIARRRLNNAVFGNDPDVFILRNENTGLDANQKHTLYLTNLIFGNLVFTSDNIANYDEDTMKLYLSAFPYKNKKILGVKAQSGIYSVKFSIGDLLYLAYINLTGLSASLKIEKGIYYGCGELISGDTYLSLDKYESVCFLKIGEGEFSIAGGTGSIFPGSEIENFKAENGEITFSVNSKTAIRGELVIKIPDGLTEIKINGDIFPAEKTDDLNLVKINLQQRNG
jgi:alpha-galactosidase